MCCFVIAGSMDTLLDEALAMIFDSEYLCTKLTSPARTVLLVTGVSISASKLHVCSVAAR